MLKELFANHDRRTFMKRAGQVGGLVLAGSSIEALLAACGQNNELLPQNISNSLDATKFYIDQKAVIGNVKFGPKVRVEDVYDKNKTKKKQPFDAYTYNVDIEIVTGYTNSDGSSTSYRTYKTSGTTATLYLADNINSLKPLIDQAAANQTLVQVTVNTDATDAYDAQNPNSRSPRQPGKMFITKVEAAAPENIPPTPTPLSSPTGFMRTHNFLSQRINMKSEIVKIRKTESSMLSRMIQAFGRRG